MTPIATDAVGASAELIVDVTDELSAEAYGDTGVSALATPALICLFERAAMQAIANAMEAGACRVGSVVNMIHRAPTPIGSQVTVVATVTS